MIDLKNKIIYYPNPKTGSTSVRNLINESSIYKFFGTENIVNEFKRWNTIYAQKGILPNLFIISELLKKKNLNIEDFMILITLRNPWERIVSGYNHALNIFKIKDSFEQYVNAIYKNDPENYIHRFGMPSISDILGNIDITKLNILYIDIEDLNSNQFLKYIYGNIKKLNISKSKKNYNTYYNKHTMKLVESMYISDITIGNYIYE